MANSFWYQKDYIIQNLANQLKKLIISYYSNPTIHSDLLPVCSLLGTKS